MKCLFNKKLLSLYLDGELSEFKVRRVQDHLAYCIKCQEELKALKKLKTVVENLSTISVSPDYELKFQKKLDEIREEQTVPQFKLEIERQVGIFENLRKRFILTPAFVRVAIGIIFIIGVSYFAFLGFDRNFPEIISIKGMVSVLPSNKANLMAAKVDMPIKEGEVIKTSSNSFIDIELNKAYKIRIKENSEVKVAKLNIHGKNAKTYLKLSKGRVLVNIESKFKGKEFKVDTPVGSAVAYGTEFLVDVNPEDGKMWLGVLRGKVGVKSKSQKEISPIFVRAKEKTIVFSNKLPTLPTPVNAEELKWLKEIDQIGKLLVSLVLSNTPQRVKELLEHPRFYAYGKEPLKTQKLIKEATLLLKEAVKENDRNKHMKCIAKLEKVINDYPDSSYTPQLMLFVGAYYEWLSMHKQAINTFQKLLKEYNESSWASLAQCAIGIIREEKLKDYSGAILAYQKVLTNYPDSLESYQAKKSLQRLLEKH
jgi:hypothetical protein